MFAPTWPWVVPAGHLAAALGRKSPGIGEKVGGGLLPRERTVRAQVGSQEGAGRGVALLGPGERWEVASRQDPAALGEMHNPGKSGPGTTPTSGARPRVTMAPWRRGLPGCHSTLFVWKTASSAGGQRAPLKVRRHTRFGSVCLGSLQLMTAPFSPLPILRQKKKVISSSRMSREGKLPDPSAE